MRIFHIATLHDWEAARVAGRYTTSTRGRTLAEEGFIHASRGDQWQAVRERWYAGITEPLLLLVIETDLLTSPVVDEEVPGTGETFPHIYGPLDVSAVVQTIPLGSLDASPGPPGGRPRTPAAAPSPSFSRLFLEEMFRNVVAASAVMLAVVVGALGGRAVDDDTGPALGALAGLVLGVLGVLGVRRTGRRARRARPGGDEARIGSDS